MGGAGLDKVKDAFIPVWLEQSPPWVEIVDQAAVPPELQRAVLRVPLACVPTELRGFVQHLDVDRAATIELVKRAGESPMGISAHSDQRHLRIRWSRSERCDGTIPKAAFRRTGGRCSAGLPSLPE